MKNPAGLLNALDEVIFELNLEGKVIAATAAARAIAGDVTPAGDALDVVENWEFARIVTSRDRARFEQTLKRIAEGKVGSHRMELGVVVADGAAGGGVGDVLPMEAKLGAVTAANGKPVSIGVWLRDLSLEKANEAAANVQGTHLLDLVENVTDACVVESADGSVEMLNEAFCRLFEIREAPQSLVGTSCAELFEAASNATEKRIGPLYFPLDAATGSNQRDELSFPLLSGETIAQASLAVDGESGIAGRLHLFHQTTPQVAGVTESAPEGMIASQMTLIGKIVRELSVAHESAGSAVYRAEQLEMPGQLLEQLRRVESAANSAVDAVAGLLDFPRIEVGIVNLEIAPFRLRECLAEMIAGPANKAAHRQVQLKIQVEQDVPDELSGDAAKLMLVLRNLLDYAIESSPLVDAAAPQSGDKQTDRRTEVTVVIAPEYTAEQQIHLSFSVEQLVRPGSTKPKTMPASSAMQLALARQIVRALASKTGDGMGENKLEVQERKLGTTLQFTAEFPFEKAKPANARPTFVTLTGVPVLIVSESISERTQLAEVVKSWRMAPREADNANVALQLLTRMAKEQNPIPLVITSNQLTTLDGFALAFRIKHHPHLKQTAIIMLAVDGKPGDAITCRENGISAYLRQPVADQQLNEAITAVIGAQDDAEATATLITRHSLREQKKAAVLIIGTARDQTMYAAGALKKKDYRVVVVASAQDAFEAMVQEQFDVIVVDPIDAGFVEGINVVATIKSHVGEGREVPKILLASESPLDGKTAFDGLVLKPFAKESILNAVADLNLAH
jgi:CheY-like chemotaxis protein/signal transduction histidine kinase